MVSSAAYLLQHVYGSRRLSFLTCTLPGSPEDTLRAAENWPEIVRVFLQWLKRNLVKRGLSPVIVSVTEIQPKRMREQGGLPLHLHIVFQGAHKDYQWCFTPSQLTRAWQRCIVGRVPGLVDSSFAAALNVQHVKTSAKGYLGKYMSKGEDDVCSVLDENPELIHCIPSTWYNLSVEARDGVRANMTEGERTGLTLERWSQWNDALDSPFKYIKRVALKDLEGHVIKTFCVGEVAMHWRRVLGVPICKDDVIGI
jgi:hypothetical protein